MKRKHATEIQAWLNLALVIFFVALAFSGEVKETFGWVFVLLFTSFFGWNSYRNFRSIRTIRDEEREHAPPTDAPPEGRIAFYKRYIIIAICLSIALPILLLMQDIDAVVRTSAHASWKVKVFAWLYQSFGFWPMTLALPTLMLLIALVYCVKIKQIKDGSDRFRKS